MHVTFPLEKSAKEALEPKSRYAFTPERTRPAILIRSRTSTKCGDVYSPVRYLQKRGAEAIFSYANGPIANGVVK